MKENKLSDAIGEIDARFITEADTATVIRRRPSRVLLIAALLAVALCAVGFTAASRFYFAPGVGIVDDTAVEPPQVWAAFDEITLGDTKIDAVVMGEGEEGYNLTVWVWRSESVEQDPNQALTGIAPKELTDFALYINDVEYSSISASMSPSGFSTYSFAGLPKAEAVTLQDSEGNTAEVALKPISESQYAHLEGITWGDGTSLSLVPVSGSANLFAGRLTDPIAAAIATDTLGTSVHARFRLTHADGTVGYATGQLELAGLKSKYTNCIKVNKEDYDKPIIAISPSYFRIIHHFTIYSPESACMPRVTITVPEIGAGYDCNEVLYEKAGLTIRLTRVERDMDGLRYTTAIDGAEKLPMQNIEPDVYLAYSMGEFSFTYNDGTITRHDAWPRYVDTDKTTGKLFYSIGHRETADPDKSDVTCKTVEPGDKLVVILNDLYYEYLPEGVDAFHPDNTETFGTIELN